MRSFRKMIRVRQALQALAVTTLLAVAAAPAHANSKYAGIVVDAKTGKTLYSSAADARRYPASLTKIMTLYIVFEELEAKRLTLSSPLKVSKYASGRPPSKLGLKPGSTIKVKDAILALVTKSANDVATVISENIGGSEKEFAKRMTRTAHQIGMSKTQFRNPHGLPNSSQYTTARDMSLLGRSIQERFPSYYKYFQTRVFTYRGNRYGNHNKLLGRVEGVDGIKTGYIRASGFNLVTSVKRDNRHIVAVVMGGRTGRSRDAYMKKLIAEYMPKASTGARTAPQLVARTTVPADIPLPTLKPSTGVEATNGAMVLAMVEPKAAAADPTLLVSGTVPLPPKAVKSRMANSFAAAGLPPASIPNANPAHTGAVPAAATVTSVHVTGTMPVAAPAPAPAPVVVASLAPAPAPAREMADDSGTSDMVATNNSVDTGPTWQIQIAAAESESGAIKMLKKAKAAEGPALRGTVPVTEEVATKGQTLYRARFAGFANKSAAWGACKSLKRSKFACYAIYQ
ncbi:D-alanyl-D-alanine carboxypeptidase [Roseibium sp.]|uniref:D-alanyl-D-alanine carboxypeptidase n=1 Tax=Roseibium sp. TaxID=1936156 RepID=UPI003A97FB5F